MSTEFDESVETVDTATEEPSDAGTADFCETLSDSAEEEVVSESLDIEPDESFDELEDFPDIESDVMADGAEDEDLWGDKELKTDISEPKEVADADELTMDTQGYDAEEDASAEDMEPLDMDVSDTEDSLPGTEEDVPPEEAEKMGIDVPDAVEELFGAEEDVLPEEDVPPEDAEPLAMDAIEPDEDGMERGANALPPETSEEADGAEPSFILPEDGGEGADQTGQADTVGESAEEISAKEGDAASVPFAQESANEWQTGGSDVEEVDGEPVKVLSLYGKTTTLRPEPEQDLSDLNEGYRNYFETNEEISKSVFYDGEHSNPEKIAALKVLKEDTLSHKEEYEEQRKQILGRMGEGGTAEEVETAADDGGPNEISQDAASDSVIEPDDGQKHQRLEGFFIREKDEGSEEENHKSSETMDYSDVQLDVVPEDRRQDVGESFSETPPEILERIKDYASDLTVSATEGKDVSHYSPEEKMIRMEQKFDNDEYAEVFKHEMGHFVDDQMGWPSESEDFRSAVANDLAVYNKQTPYGRERFEEMLDELFESGAAHDRCISDMLSGMFQNDEAIVKRYHDEGVSYYQHDNDYWNKGCNRENEIFANSFSMHSTADAESCQYFEKCFKHTNDRFKKIFNMEKQ